MANYEKPHILYGPWLHDQLKGVVDQANQRKGEVPADHSADVHSALGELEKVLAKLKHYAK